MAQQSTSGDDRLADDGAVTDVEETAGDAIEHDGEAGDAIDAEVAEELEQADVGATEDVAAAASGETETGLESGAGEDADEAETESESGAAEDADGAGEVHAVAATEDVDALDEAADAEAEAVARRKAERRARRAEEASSSAGSSSARAAAKARGASKGTDSKGAASKSAAAKGAAAKGAASKGGASTTSEGKAARRQRERLSRAEQEKRRKRSGNPAKRGTAMKQPLQPPTARDWVRALRLRTLPMSIAPVAVGAAAAYNLEGFHLGIALLCLGVALFLQLGVNVANDYSDGVRGTDAERVGPKRITTSTTVDPKVVRNVAIALLAVGAACGIALAIVSQRWWLLAVGAVCVLLAWFYTGGKRPYGYFALGELVAFVIFGPVAVVGTMYATLGRWSEDGIVLSLAMGCFAAALMLVNNLRDIDSDRAAGKHTVPTIIGRTASKVLYALLILVPFGILWIYAMALAYGPIVMLTLVVALPTIVIVAMGRTPRDFVTALGLTSLTTLLYGVGVALTFWAGVTGFAF